MQVAYIQERRYEVKPISTTADGWVSLSCNGEHIAKLVSFEEARRVIWMYWTNIGICMDYLTEYDFDEIEDE